MENDFATTIDQLCINTIRTLAIDAVEKANSGHPGAPMALAPAAYTLWTRVMNHNPENPSWFNRDRFVLSNGHASMLLYSLLHLTGYDLPLDEIKRFRQWASRTPGHPEYGHTAGVETTTGPLGQGLMNAVGMAMAEAHLAACYNRDGFKIVDHHTYVFCGDGDLMEGASHEAASIAGHLGLGKLICLYDDNHISIEGETEITYTDNVGKRFESYNWHVINLGDKGNDIAAIAEAYAAARQVTDRPSLIILRTHIGFGAPEKQDTPEAHGSPLGAAEARQAKKNYDWPEDAAFLIPDGVYEHMQSALTRGRQSEQEWQELQKKYTKAHPELAARFGQALAGKTDDLELDLRFIPDEGPLATRSASGKAINSFVEKLHWIVGGSADLAPSNNSLMKSSNYFSRDNYQGRNIAFGVREHLMCASASGMVLHGGVRPFVATFFVFTDYARPAIRLAALMGLPVIYVMTHDSVGVGEDGPTHQPVEHLNALRMIPGLTLIRPADANETVFAWQAALKRLDGPTMLVLTRQKLPIMATTATAGADGVARGAYVLSKERGERPEVILIASGSEVQWILAAQGRLAEKGIDARVVSMPSWELFEGQPEQYRISVLPEEVRARLAVEAGSSLGWQKWTGSGGDILAIDRFGASAPAEEVFQHYGFTVDNVVAKAMALSEKNQGRG